MSGKKTSIIMLAVILGIICLITAAALGVVNGMTAPVIAKGATEAKTAAFGNMFPGATFEESTVPPTKAIVEGFEVKSGADLTGRVVVAAPQGFGGPIKFAVGFDAEGVVTGITFLEMAETSGIGDRIKEPSFVDTIIGKSSFDGVATISGATISSSAVLNGMKEAASAASQMGNDFSDFVVEPDPTAKSALKALLPDAKFSGTYKIGKYNVKQDGKKIGTAVSTKAYGYNAEKPMKMVVIFDTEGKVLNLDVWSCDETTGIGSRVLEREFLDKFIGQSPECNVELLTGATVSSKAVRAAVDTAAEMLGQTLVPRTLEDKAPEPAAPAPEAPADGYADGIYNGVGQGFSGAEIKATVTVSGGKISALVLETAETHPSGADKQKEDYTKITEAILAANAPVDTVAGVTLSISLGGVKTAVTDALAQAMPSTGAMLPLNNGTFTGTGKGFSDAEITATITIVDGKIGDVLLETKETHPGGTDKQKADFDKISAAVKAANGPVDSVAGVTIAASITGVKNAVNAALAQAGGTDDATPAPDAPATPEVPAGAIADGTYTGTGKGFNEAEIKAVITVSDGKFTDVALTTKETHPGGTDKQKADFDKISAAIKAANGPVDQVSGVTIAASVAGAKTAVTNALKSTSAAPAAPVETPAEPEAPKADGPKDGTYTGTGKGFNDAEIKATITISGGKITEAKLETAETHPASVDAQKEAFGKIEQAIVKADGAVDTVSGVTLTISLGGAKTAVNNALAKAK